MRIWSDLHHWQRLKIRRGDLVLDVGCGDRPFPRADVLCDKFLHDATERGGVPILRDRPLVAGDAEALPFRDKCFDYVYCSHLIEHVPNPEQVLDELSRVGRAGCIVAPTRVREKLYSMATHRWFVSRRGDVLVVQQKARPHFDEDLMSLAYRAPRRLLRHFHKMWTIAPDYFELWFEWSGSIKYDVVRNAESAASGWVTAKVQHQHIARGWMSEQRRSAKALAISLFGKAVRAVHSARRLPSIYELIACPVCRSSVAPRTGGQVVCSGCSRVFPVADGVPVMLSEDG